MGGGVVPWNAQPVKVKFLDPGLAFTTKTFLSQSPNHSLHKCLALVIIKPGDWKSKQVTFPHCTGYWVNIPFVLRLSFCSYHGLSPFLPPFPTFTPCPKSPVSYSTWRSKKSAEPAETDPASLRLADWTHTWTLPLCCSSSFIMSPKSLAYKTWPVLPGCELRDQGDLSKCGYFLFSCFDPTGSFWSVDSFRGQGGFLSRVSAASLGRPRWRSGASASSRVRPLIVNRTPCRFGSSLYLLEQGCQVTG